jgi:SAM-dependent methyltransferase
MRVPRKKEKIDWNELWKEDFAPRPTESNLEFWDDFAPRFRKKLEPRDDPYIAQFYEFSGFRQGESIFDMGCASGTLAIPFAKMGHEIYAADFSGEMLKHLMIGAREEGVSDMIHPIRLDWNKDWSARDLPVCDVAISSRSFVPWDMSEAIRKLESVARDRVCIGAWDTPAHGYDRKVARYIGIDRPGYGCYAYIMNELMDRDLLPELRFIRSPFRLAKYDSPEDARRQLAEAFCGELTDEQMCKLDEYIDKHLRYYCDGSRRSGNDIDIGQNSERLKCHSNDSRQDGGNTGSGQHCKHHRFEANADGQYWKFDHGNESTIAHIMWKVPGAERHTDERNVERRNRPLVPKCERRGKWQGN